MFNKYIIITRKNAVVLLAALFIISIILIVIATVMPYMYAMTKARMAEGVICSTDRSGGEISLTFDISDGSEYIGELLTLLEQRDVKCTFFVTGEWARQNPECVALLAGDGHEIMNGGNNLNPVTGQRRSAVYEFINSGAEEIQTHTGTRPMLFRSCDGEYDKTALNALTVAGMLAIRWDVDSMDHTPAEPDAIANHIVSQAGSGSIIRYSSVSRRTLDSLPAVLDGLFAKNGKFVTVSQMLYTDYIIDYDGKQLAR